MENVITLTDCAAQHIKSMLEKEAGAVGFRIAIKKTGCSGYAYLPELIHSVKSEDIHFVAQNNLNVYVDANSVDFIKGLIIDFVIEKTGLKQKRLIYINPNEKNRCGCGESFTIE